MSDFRIEYTILMDDEEVGFGSSGTWDDLDSCTHAIGTDVQRGVWETSGDMPSPDEVKRKEHTNDT